MVQEIGPYREDRTQNIDMVKQWLSYQDKSIASPFRPATVGDSLGLAKPKIIAHSNIESFSLVVKEPLEPLALLAAISLVQQQYGDSILRIKGILNLKGQDKPVIIHGVQGSLYPLTELDSWPDNEQVSKLVFIVRATVKEQIEHIFKQALEHPDEASLAYYQQIIDAADLSGSATDNNQA